jgi:hypothetical protein
MDNLTLIITAWLYDLNSTTLPRVLVPNPQIRLVSCKGMSSSIPPMRFGWELKEMSDTGTKGRPNHKLLTTSGQQGCTCLV